ncbi:BQ2448_5030 [Microbotryum intermedium]|uniref:BQ2448_5030 protein n=1 Tax=Microbotryum intermedium TaxID=269621 RepID=A0A238F3X4_9BASI|nr:BQ2448_5030 [Microbotryum intermedium]
MASEPVRIAVIGSGLAGLVTAYSLQTLKATHPDGSPLQLYVELFEKSQALGMDSTSISVDFGDGTTPFRFDSPMRSINGVFQLYKHLDVALRRADFSYSFARLSRNNDGANVEASPPPPYAVKDGETLNGFVTPPRSGKNVKRQPQRTQFFYVYLLLLAFAYSWMGLTSRTSRRYWLRERLGLDRLATESVDEFCERYWIGDRMKNEVLVPLYAAVSTVGRQQARDMPVAECLGELLRKDQATMRECLRSDSRPSFIIEYIVSTFGSSHYVAEAGVQQVVRRLVAPIPIDQVHLSSAITSITTSSSTSLHQPIKPPLLPTSSALVPVLSALQSISYVRTLVVNHTDASILPQIEQDHRDLNLVSYDAPRPASDSKGEFNDIDTSTRLGKGSIQATHIISRTHPRLCDSSLGRELYQTTNPIVDIDENKILSTAWYERAVVTRESKKILPGFLLEPSSKIGQTYQGRENFWFVGSWCAEGIPLLEGCLTSSERVVKELVKVLGVEKEVRLRW